MVRARLAFDIADSRWFEPYQTVFVEVDTNVVSFFYPVFDMTVRVAKMTYEGREFILYNAGPNQMRWETRFGASVGILRDVTWDEALRMNFEGVSIEGVGKVVVEVLDRTSV